MIHISKKAQNRECHRGGDYDRKPTSKMNRGKYDDILTDFRNVSSIDSQNIVSAHVNRHPRRSCASYSNKDSHQEKEEDNKSIHHLSPVKKLKRKEGQSSYYFCLKIVRVIIKNMIIFIGYCHLLRSQRGKYWQRILLTSQN